MFGHPKGLFILFFTELWERFSFYGMKAILVLYMVSEVTKGGFGWTESYALWVLGWYGFYVYAMSIPGGIIADNLIGQRKAVLIGGLLLCAGQFLLAYKEVWAFFTALWLIIGGVGMLKPNISVMVGGLYEKNDPRQDAGFTIFYMGINVGALLSPILVGLVAEFYGWNYGFILAGIGMFVAQMTYLWGQKYLGESGLLKKKEDQTPATARLNKLKKIVSITKVERDRLIAILISFLIVLIFWAAFEQAGGLMTLYTEHYSNREILGVDIPTAMFQSLNPLFIILLAPGIAYIWIKLGKVKKDPSSIFKMGLGTFILGIGFLFMVVASIEHRDGEKFVFSSLNKKIQAWEVSSGKNLKTFENHKNKVTTAAISEDGKFLISSDTNNLLKIWETKTGKVIETIDFKHDNITNVKLSGEYIILGLRNGSIKLYDMDNKKITVNVKAHKSSITALAVSSNGKYLVSGSKEGIIKVWHLNSLDKAKVEPAQIIKYHNNTITDVSISGYGDYIVSCSLDNTMRVWKFDQKKQSYISKYVYENGARAIAISQEANYIVTGLKNGFINLWNLEKDKLSPPILLKKHTGSVNSILISMDTRFIIAGQGNTISIWEYHSPAEIKNTNNIKAKHSGLWGFKDSKSAMLWLVLAYLFHTIGELCLSPVALSFITKTAPERMQSSVMGIYFAVTGGGNWIASILGMLAASFGELGIFGGIAVFTMAMGCLLMLLTKLINKLTHENVA